MAKRNALMVATVVADNVKIINGADQIQAVSELIKFLKFSFESNLLSYRPKLESNERTKVKKRK